MIYKLGGGGKMTDAKIPQTKTSWQCQIKASLGPVQEGGMCSKACGGVRLKLGNGYFWKSR